jgi:DNA-binding transcriptional MerR regulator
VAIYSIKDLEQLTGIRAHTIRIWEQRYGLICPCRTKSNIRYYEDDELKLLLNIALLNRNGYKISKIATMSRDEIAAVVEQLSESHVTVENQIDALTIAMIEMDEHKFDHVLSANISAHGFEQTIHDLINPFLERLTFLWFTSSIKPAHDNFMSYRLRQKLCRAIDSEPLPHPHAPKVLMFLPQGDTSELPLLFSHYMIKIKQYNVIYLGGNNSLADVIEAYKIKKPEYIYTYLSEHFTQNLQQYLNNLANSFPAARVVITGYHAGINKVQIPENVIMLPTQEAVNEYFSNNSPMSVPSRNKEQFTY